MPLSQPADDTLDVAFVVGAHEFDAPAAKEMWDALTGVQIYPQDLPTFTRDMANARSSYDAVVFYNFHEHDIAGSQRPVHLTETAYRTTIDTIRTIGDNGMGIVPLHHGLAAFPEEDEWQQMCGIPGGSLETTHFDERFQIDVADSNHPITSGLSSFEFLDETYSMAEPTDDSNVLLVAPDAPGMDAIAWTRRYRDSRVFCYQSGHDTAAFTSSQFRTVLARGIRWAAGVKPQDRN